MCLIYLEISSFTHLLFRNVCYLVSKYLGIFPSVFLLLIPSLIPSLSESNCIISTLLNLLRCVSLPRMCSVLVNVPCDLEKNVYILVCLDDVVDRCQLYPVDPWCCGVQLCPYWFSVCRTCTFLIEGCGSLQL